MVDRDISLHTGTFASTRESLAHQRQKEVFRYLRQRAFKMCQLGTDVKRNTEEGSEPLATDNRRRPLLQHQEHELRQKVEKNCLSVAESSVEGTAPFLGAAGVPMTVPKYFLQYDGFNAEPDGRVYDTAGCVNAQGEHSSAARNASQGLTSSLGSPLSS